MFNQIEHFSKADYYRVETGRDFSFPIHIHSSFEIIVVLDGEMEITVGCQKKLLRKNQAALIFPNQIHSLKTEKNSRHILCIFSQKLVNHYFRKASTFLAESNYFSPDIVLIDFFEKIQLAKNTSSIKGILYLLCGDFDAQAKYIPKTNVKSDALLFKVLDYVDKNYQNECSLKTLAEYLSYDYYYLSKFFISHVSISFNSYVNNYRISEACHLLSTTDKSMLKISLECGYASVRSFNRNFKKIIGVVPLKYQITNQIDFTY